jgi:hypothetical protein
LTGLGLMLLSLPFLRLGMSIAGFWLAGVWIFDYVFDCSVYKDPWKKWQLFWHNRAARWLTAIFFLHVVGLLWTSNFEYGIHDLRIKLPLLFMPLVFSGTPKIGKRELHWLLWVFIAALLASSLWCLAYFYQTNDLYDVRDISVFISHIRFSLMIALGIGVLIYLLHKSRGLVKLLNLVLIIYFAGFLWLLQSLTGFVALAMVVFSWWIFYALKANTKKQRMLRSSLPLAIFIFAAGYIYLGASEYFTPKRLSDGPLPQETAQGNPYDHDPENTLMENGFFVWRYLNRTELEKEWNERSSIDFTRKDKRGQPLSSTLIRYLTSKGLTKDSVGVAALNEKDIKLIEKGVANHLEPQKSGIEERLDATFFEVNAYFNGADPSGNSFTQRFEFWRAGWHIIEKNPVIGVGTGDVPDAFESTYDEIDSPLDERWRLRAHNQYLTMAVAFGAVGFAFFVYCFFYPLSRKKYRNDFLYVTFFLISAVSFLNEDTLETQAGITFFTFFSCFFLFVYNRDSVNTSL